MPAQFCWGLKVEDIKQAGFSDEALVYFFDAYGKQQFILTDKQFVNIDKLIVKLHNAFKVGNEIKIQINCKMDNDVKMFTAIPRNLCTLIKRQNEKQD